MTKSEHPGLSIEALSVRYGAIRALDGLSLSVARGEHVAIVGPSGSGKSTLLRCVAGLMMPAQGRIAWQETMWTDSDARLCIAPEARRIGMMTQHPALWPHLTARKHLLLTLKWRGVGRGSRAEEAERLLELVALTHRAEHKPAELSGGEAQRLALARALCAGSQLLLLDEPLSQLDVLLRESIARMTDEAAKHTGATILHVTHDPADVVSTANRVGVLENGRLVQIDTPTELASHPATAFSEAVARRMARASP